MRERKARYPKTNATNSGDEDHRRDGKPEAVEGHPVRRQLVVTEEDHEVRKVTLVLSQLADLQHQIHAKRIAPERKEKALPEAKQTGKSPQDIHPDRQNCISEVLAVEIDGEIRNVEWIRFRNEGVQGGKNTENNDGGNGDAPDFKPTDFRIEPLTSPQDCGCVWEIDLQASTEGTK